MAVSHAFYYKLFGKIERYHHKAIACFTHLNGASCLLIKFDSFRFSKTVIENPCLESNDCLVLLKVKKSLFLFSNTLITGYFLHLFANEKISEKWS